TGSARSGSARSGAGSPALFRLPTRSRAIPLAGGPPTTPPARSHVHWVGPPRGGLDRTIGTSAKPESVHFENQSGLGGMPSQVVYGIESDREGRLWLSTNNGLARLDPRLHSVKLFHQVHGLQDEEFNSNAHFRSADGILYFGGNHGFNAFSPNLIGSEGSAPPVGLTMASKLNQPMRAQELH